MTRLPRLLALTLIAAMMFTLPLLADCVQIDIDTNTSNVDVQVMITLTTAQTHPVLLNQATVNFLRGHTQSLMLCGDTNPKAGYDVHLYSSTTEQGARTTVGWRTPLPFERNCGIGPKGGFTCQGNLQ